MTMEREGEGRRRACQTLRPPASAARPVSLLRLLSLFVLYVISVFCF